MQRETSLFVYSPPHCLPHFISPIPIRFFISIIFSNSIFFLYSSLFFFFSFFVFLLFTWRSEFFFQKRGRRILRALCHSLHTFNILGFHIHLLLSSDLSIVRLFFSILLYFMVRCHHQCGITAATVVVVAAAAAFLLF